MKKPVKPLHLPLIGKITQDYARNLINGSAAMALLIGGQGLLRYSAGDWATGIGAFLVYSLLALAIYRRSKIAILIALILTASDIYIGNLRGASFRAMLPVAVYFIVFIAGAIGIFVYQSKSSEKQGFDRWKGWSITLAAFLVSAWVILIFARAFLEL